MNHPHRLASVPPPPDIETVHADLMTEYETLNILLASWSDEYSINQQREKIADLVSYFITPDDYNNEDDENDKGNPVISAKPLDSCEEIERDTPLSNIGEDEIRHYLLRIDASKGVVIPGLGNNSKIKNSREVQVGDVYVLEFSNEQFTIPVRIFVKSVTNGFNRDKNISELQMQCFVCVPHDKNISGTSIVWWVIPHIWRLIDFRLPIQPGGGRRFEILSHQMHTFLYIRGLDIKESTLKRILSFPDIPRFWE